MDGEIKIIASLEPKIYKDLDRLEAALKDVEKEAENTSKELKDSFKDAGTDNFGKELKTVTNEIKNQTKELNSLNNKLSQLNQAKKSATDPTEFKRLTQEIRETKAAIIDTSKSLVSNQIKSNVQGFTGSISKGFDAFKGKLSDSKKDVSTFVDSFGDIRQSIIGIVTGSGSLSSNFGNLATSIGGATKAGLAFIATPIGATIAAISAIGLAANEVLKYNESIRESVVLTTQITKLTGEQADAIRIQSGVLAETFGQDQKELLEVARNQVQAFGISYEDAFKVIQDNLVRGAGANSEFLESLREYPKFFADAGFSLSEFADIVNAGYDLGVYSDKLPDAIKEFSLSIQEQAPATRDALSNAFGDTFTDNLLASVKTGETSVKDALQAIAKESDKTAISQQAAAQLTADVFRGAGEDVGGFLTLIDAVNEGLNREQRELTELEKITEQTLNRNLELAKAKDEALRSDSVIAFKQSFVNAWTVIQTQFFKAITAIREGYNNFVIGVKTSIGFFGALPSAFVNVSKGILTSFKTIASSAKDLGNIFIDLINFKNPTDSFNKFTETLSKGFEQGKDSVAGFNNEIANATKEARRLAIEQSKANEQALVAQSKLNKEISKEKPKVYTDVKINPNNYLALQKEIDALKKEVEIRAGEINLDVSVSTDIEKLDLENIEVPELDSTSYEDLLQSVILLRKGFKGLGEDGVDASGLINEGLNRLLKNPIFQAVGQIGGEFLSAYQSGLDTAISKNEEFINSLGDTISQLEDKVAQENELAKQGFANNKSIAEQELAAAKERQAQAIAEQEKIAQRQKRIDDIQRASTMAVAFAEIIKDAAVFAPTAVLAPILAGAGIAAVLTLLNNSVAKQNTLSFYDGTEDTGRGGKVDSRGGFNAVLHPNERVVPAKDNKFLKGIKNSELPKMAEIYKSLNYRPNYEYFENMQAKKDGINAIVLDNKRLESLGRERNKELKKLNKNLSKNRVEKRYGKL